VRRHLKFAVGGTAIVNKPFTCDGCQCKMVRSSAAHISDKDDYEEFSGRREHRTRLPLFNRKSSGAFMSSGCFLFAFEILRFSRHVLILFVWALQELFIQSLAQRAFQDSNGVRDLGYKHVAEVIQTEEEYDFLRGWFLLIFVALAINLLLFQKFCRAKSK